MASYIYSFTAASSDITTFKEIPLEPSLGGYAQSNSGHQAIDISVVDSAQGTNNHTLQLAWVDCDADKANPVLGVTKIDVITASPAAGPRRTGLSNSTGGYVFTVSCASSSSSLAKITGIGSCTDLRSTTASVTPRRLFIGLTALGAGGGTITVIVTPTKIV